MHCCPYLLLKRRKMKLANLLYNAQQHPHLGITMFFVFYDVRKQFYRVKNEDKAYLCLLHLEMLPRVGCVSLFKIHAAALEESCGPPVVVTDPEAMAFLYVRTEPLARKYHSCVGLQFSKQLVLHHFSVN